MREVQGDLFTADVEAIGHGCNLKGVMGAGVAKIVRNTFPDMLPEYEKRCKDKTLILGDVMVWPLDEDDSTPFKALYNMGTQVLPGAHARLDAIVSSTVLMLAHALGNDIKSVGIPQIGCGIGGLSWENSPISKFVDTEDWHIPGVRPALQMVSALFPTVDLVVYSL